MILAGIYSSTLLTWLKTSHLAWLTCHLLSGRERNKTQMFGGFCLFGFYAFLLLQGNRSQLWLFSGSLFGEAGSEQESPELLTNLNCLEDGEGMGCCIYFRGYQWTASQDCEGISHLISINRAIIILIKWLIMTLKLYLRFNSCSSLTELYVC